MDFKNFKFDTKTWVKLIVFFVAVTFIMTMLYTVTGIKVFEWFAIVSTVLAGLSIIAMLFKWLFVTKKDEGDE